jgi:two-component system, NarL family, nitrate/nitrite response regulator NarL
MTNLDVARIDCRRSAVAAWRPRRLAGTADAIRVLIVDRHAMLAHGLRAVLDEIEDFHVAGVAATPQFAIELAAGDPPDVVVMDRRSADGDGTDGVARLLAAWPDVRVLVISAVADYRSVMAAVEKGAAGYLLTHQPLDDLVEGIRSARLGQMVLAPSLVPALLAGMGPVAARTMTITRREAEALQLLAEGLSTAELAKRMGVSVNTVRNTIQGAITRLGAHSKLEAVSIALREGIVAPPTRRL